MNPTVQRFLPPALVFGAAIYFAWPPSEPLDLGDDLVKAKAVRWDKEDLGQLPMVDLKKDPFEPVLVAEQAAEPQQEEVAVVVFEPAGPTPEMIQSELTLTGIANMAGRPWAIVNGRPRLPGDLILTEGAAALTCEIVSVHADHVVVRCQSTLATIRPVPASRREAPAAVTSDPTQPQAGANQVAVPPTGSVAPPNA